MDIQTLVSREDIAVRLPLLRTSLAVSPLLHIVRLLQAASMEARNTRLPRMARKQVNNMGPHHTHHHRLNTQDPIAVHPQPNRLKATVTIAPTPKGSSTVSCAETAV